MHASSIFIQWSLDISQPKYNHNLHQPRELREREFYWVWIVLCVYNICTYAFRLDLTKTNILQLVFLLKKCILPLRSQFTGFFHIELRDRQFQNQIFQERTICAKNNQKITFFNRKRTRFVQATCQHVLEHRTFLLNIAQAICWCVRNKKFSLVVSFLHSRAIFLRTTCKIILYPGELFTPLNCDVNITCTTR